MSTFNLDASFARAAERLQDARRRPRSDAGQSRLHPAVEHHLRSRFLAQERPRIRDLQRELSGLCKGRGIEPPSRATIYNAIARCKPTAYRAENLPEPVRHALYNVALDGEIPGAQVAFYAFNYGDLHAVSWAAAMPWLALFHAARQRGWRPKSRGLLGAVLRWRDIP